MKGGYKEEIEDTTLKATFVVDLDPGWNPDVYKDNAGSVREKVSEVKWSGTYYIGYTKGTSVGTVYSFPINMAVIAKISSV